MPVSIGAAAFIIAIQALSNAPLGIFLKPKNVLNPSQSPFTKAKEGL
jgi:hypothetical protein